MRPSTAAAEPRARASRGRVVLAGVGAQPAGNGRGTHSVALAGSSPRESAHAPLTATSKASDAPRTPDARSAPSFCPPPDAPSRISGTK